MSHFYTNFHNSASGRQQQQQQQPFDLETMLDIASNVLPGLAEQWPQFAAQAEQFAPQLFGATGGCPAFARERTAGNGSFSPKMDTEERPESNEMVLTLELPGIARERIGIDVTPGMDATSAGKLVVSGETEARVAGAKFTSRERSVGKFERTVTLPKGVTAEDVKADFADGVLTVVFPLRKSVVEGEKTRVSIN